MSEEDLGRGLTTEQLDQLQFGRFLHTRPVAAAAVEDPGWRSAGYNKDTQPGPCCICGATNYNLSMGGPTICPKCDCGHFDAATVQMQAKVIADLNERCATYERQCEQQRYQLVKEKAENFAMAAGLCPHQYGDEYGNSRCREIDRLRERLDKLETGVEAVVSAFENDEAQGYRSKDRQFAIDILRMASPKYCTCGGDPGQPGDHHDISCPYALNDEQGNSK